MSMFNDIGQKDAMKNNVFQIPKKSRITRGDSRKDIGRSFDLEMKRNGMEIVFIKPERKWNSAATRMLQRFEETSNLYGCQCLESWNAEKNKRKRNHTLNCGCFAYITFFPKHSLSKSAQFLRSSFRLEWTAWSKSKRD